MKRHTACPVNAVYLCWIFKLCLYLVPNFWIILFRALPWEMLEIGIFLFLHIATKPAPHTHSYSSVVLLSSFSKLLLIFIIEGDLDGLRWTIPSPFGISCRHSSELLLMKSSSDTVMTVHFRAEHGHTQTYTHADTLENWYSRGKHFGTCQNWIITGAVLE